jgi:tetratricopeptide (TPR) repeat protein
MSVSGKFPLGALWRLGAAGVAVGAGALSGDAALTAALATVATSYFVNRATDVEGKFEDDARASKNHHLQLALAGALRTTLDELQPLHPGHKPLFDAWEALLEAALDDPLTLLPAIIPAEFDPLLDAANPFTDQDAAFQEAESLLRFWLAYQRAFDRTGNYPAVPPSTLPELPADLRQSLRTEFLPRFQKAFANLLVQNDSAYARRAFERRHLQELVAASRKHTAILERLEPQLQLPLVHLRPPDPWDERRELEILRAENRAIPVVGRATDLVGLHAWLASPARVSCRILTGPAGAGKTRLAIQFLEELAGSDWDAGFLRGSGLIDPWQRLWAQPTVAIVDYAASAADTLKTWLAHLADLQPAHPLRVLLLEREANPDSGWLRLLLDRTSTGHRIASLLDPPTPQRVTPLADLAVRRQILESTLLKLGAKPALPPPGSDRLFDRHLAESRWEDPLYLMMAAVVARQPGSLPQALSLTRTDLAFRLADRELDRVRKFLPPGAPTEAAQLLTHLAGIVTASRSLEPADLVAIAKEESVALALDFPGGVRVAALRAAEALNRQGRPAPIEPDIIGEAALLRCFGGENSPEGAEALVRAARRASRRNAPGVCFAITHTCQDFASDECQEPLDWVEAFIRAGESDDLGLLLALEGQMPHDTLVLRERAARVDELLLTRFTQLQETSPSDETKGMRARFANNLSLRLSALGRREEALALAEEAVRLYQQLAGQRPDTFLPGLAMSLHNLANSLHHLGRREEALAQAEEAVRLYRQLAQQRPDAFLPDLATSLNNLATMLSDLGRREEALAQAEEAVRIRWQLAEQRPDAFLPDLAMSLNNLALMLSALGRHEEALAKAEEAVRIYRRLALQRPDAFLPYLATSLNNLAAMLRDLGRREEALAQAEESVRIYRQLAQQRPDAFLPDLAASLSNLAVMLRDLGRREEALAQAEEAVRLYGQLAERRPDAFLPYLAGSLNNLATMLRDLGRHEEALARAEEAVRIYRQLAEQRPDAFLPNLAASLNTLANMLRDLGRREEALARAEESVRLRRQLAEQQPDAFLPDLAGSLHNLAIMLSDLGRREEALVQGEKAVCIYRQLAQQRPGAFLPDLAGSLNSLATTLSELGRRAEALAQAEEAVRLYGQLAQQRPDAFLPDLAGSLNNLATMFSDLGRREEASVRAEESVRVYRQLAQQRPDVFLHGLAMSLNNLATMLSEIGRSEEALAQAEEAIRLDRQLAKGRPDAFLPGLARSLTVSGHILLADHPREAIEPLAEAIRLLTPFFSMLPQAHAPLMRYICALYALATLSVDVAPDIALLSPVAAAFEKLNSSEHA